MSTQNPSFHSTSKSRLFTALMLLIPVVFFVLLELGLQLGGYGNDYPLFVEVPGYADYLYPSRDVGKRYFSTLSAPSIPFDSFKAKKVRDTYRIFVQGGSSAAGYPFYYGGSFVDMLEQRLLQTFPGRDIEVINTAMAAVNSYTLLDLADEIIVQEPDAVLIYAGHNEYYGALGIGSTESIGQLRPLVNMYLRLRSFRTVQVLRAFLGWAAGLFADGPTSSGVEPAGGTLMERIVGNQAIAFGSAEYNRGLQQFRGNLVDLLEKYKRHGIPVYISTIASNERDLRPFSSGLASGTDEASWRQLMRRGIESVSKGDTTAALAAFDAAIALDSISADAYYAKARLLDASHYYDAARPAYLAAKDRDQLPFRAPEAINQIIREEASAAGAFLVDAHAQMAGKSHGGIVGNNFMLEHLHPNVDGYFQIADAFYDALRQQQVIGSWEQAVSDSLARREVLLTPLDSIAGMYRVQKLMSGWPFQPLGHVDDKLATLNPQTPVEHLAYELYTSKLNWREAIERLRVEFEKQGDYHSALRAALAVIQRYPFLANPYLAAGNLLVRQGRYDEALVYFHAANDREETGASQRMIGSILLQHGNLEAAIAHLRKARTLEPDNVQTLYNLSGAYAMDGQYAQARSIAERLLQLQPDHTATRQLLASLPASR